MQSAPSRPSILKRHLGNPGFTLVEAMILAGVIAVLIATFSTYSFNRVRQLQAANDRKNIAHVQGSIKSAAAQTESITQTEELQWEAKPTPTPF